MQPAVTQPFFSDFAFVNSGGIRSDLIAGDLTLEDVYSVLPFNNTLDKAIMTGYGVKQVLIAHNHFFQISSGLRIVYNKLFHFGKWELGDVRTQCGEKHDK